MMLTFFPFFGDIFWVYKMIVLGILEQIQVHILVDIG